MTLYKDIWLVPKYGINNKLLCYQWFKILDSPVFYPDICKTFKLPSKSFMKIIKPFQSSKSILTQVFASILALIVHWIITKNTRLTSTCWYYYIKIRLKIFFIFKKCNLILMINTRTTRVDFFHTSFFKCDWWDIYSQKT